MKDIHFNNRNNAAFLLILSRSDNTDVTPVTTEYTDDADVIYTDDAGDSYVTDF